MHRTTICSKTLVFYLSTAISPRGQSSLALFCLAFEVVLEAKDRQVLLEAQEALAWVVEAHAVPTCVREAASLQPYLPRLLHHVLF